MRFIVEFEGFHFLCKFVFKEIVVHCVETGETGHYFVKAPFHLTRLSKESKRIVKYSEDHLHRIFWNSGKDYLADVRKNLRFINSSANTVFTKGNQKADILKRQLGITCTVTDVTNLVEERVSKYRMALADYTNQNKETILCPLRFHRSSGHCAYIKAAFLADLIKKLDDEQVYTSQPKVSEDVVEGKGRTERSDT
jgi:hypothetical protein